MVGQTQSLPTGEQTQILLMEVQKQIPIRLNYQLRLQDFL
jgi:hypothetical protein